MAIFGHELGKMVTANSGKIKGQYVDIACKAWFTSAGRIMPLMIKVKNADEEIFMMDIIHINRRDEKSFSGVLGTEFYCTVIFMEQRYEIRLIYFKEECKWVLTV